MEYAPLRRGVAEFVGAFTLVFIGGGAAIVAGSDLVAVALANGLAIGVMVSNLGHVSGAHFNPAITIAFLATRRIRVSLAAIYVIAQLAGATAAAGVLRWIYVKQDLLAPAVPNSPFVNDGKAVVIELVLTIFLVWAVWATAVDPRGAFTAIAGLAIGLTITIDVLMGGLLTGAAMNPARAFGPELVTGFWGDAWIYWVGPILGALVAAFAYDWLYLRPPEPAVVGTRDSGVDEPRAGDTAVN